MMICGVDPGVTGAAVVLDDASLQVVAVLELPLVRLKALAWIDGGTLRDWLIEWGPELCVIEHVGYWPGDARKNNTAAMIRIAGGVEAIVTLCGIPLVHAAPAAWKRRAGLLGRDKTFSLSLAKSRLAWPGGTLRLERHHNRAEAALIALYGRAAAAPPKPVKRSKVVLRKMAEDVPLGPLFGR
jgi:crossover junction endodeoxyribonuclease RuvC